MMINLVFMEVIKVTASMKSKFDGTKLTELYFLFDIHLANQLRQLCVQVLFCPKQKSIPQLDFHECYKNGCKSGKDAGWNKPS